MVNVIKFIVLVSLGIFIGRESLRYERDTLTELINAVKEQPVNINIIQMQPKQESGLITSDPLKWKAAQYQDDLVLGNEADNELHLQSTH
tara:strand:- start:1737 stop:2006 length:270 start_codon:yes stop_codon:yes gene_type:complete